jgi:hypothetical protein
MRRRGPPLLIPSSPAADLAAHVRHRTRLALVCCLRSALTLRSCTVVRLSSGAQAAAVKRFQRQETSARRGVYVPAGRLSPLLSLKVPAHHGLADGPDRPWVAPRRWSARRPPGRSDPAWLSSFVNSGQGRRKSRTSDRAVFISRLLYRVGGPSRGLLANEHAEWAHSPSNGSLLVAFFVGRAITSPYALDVLAYHGFADRPGIVAPTPKE